MTTIINNWTISVSTDQLKEMLQLWIDTKTGLSATVCGFSNSNDYAADWSIKLSPKDEVSNEI